MKRGFLVAIATLAVLPAFALEVRVVGFGGDPVTGLRVQLVGGETAEVGRDGRCSLADRQLPFELVVVDAASRVLLRHTVSELPAGVPLELRLPAQVRETVSVVAAAPEIEFPPAAAYTAVRSADLEQRAPASLLEALAGVPGAGRIGDGPSAVPSLRGMAKARTLILLDEGRVSAERRAGPSATFLDPASVAEIEVVRGPGSVAYGSDAFGGVIRAVTRMPRLGEPAQLRWQSHGSIGTNELGLNLEYAAPVLGGAAIAAISARTADDFEAPDGTVRDSGFESRSMRLGYVRSLAGGMLELLWRTDLARDLYKPAADSNVTSTVYPTEDSHRFSARYERLGIGAWSRVATTLSWDQYRLVLDRDRLPTADKARRISESDVFSHDYGLRLEAERPLGGARLLVGLDASGRFGLRAVNRTTNYDLAGVQTNVDREVSVERAQRDDIGAFATLVGGRGPLTLSAGLRIDRVVAANDGGHFGDRRVDHVAWSGFAAASWRLAPGLEASVQGARGFRDALLSDRYYRGVSGRGFITGNPELEPESSRQLDAALRYTRGRWRVALYGYGYRIDDLIERYKQGEDYFFRNRGEAELAGVELEGACELGRGLLLQLALQSQRGTVRDDGSALDDVPPRAAILTLRRDPAARWWWFARLGAYVRDDRPGPTERVVPGYSVVDGGAGFRLSRALEIQLLGRNLLDRSFYGSADALTVWAPGRSLELSLRGVL